MIYGMFQIDESQVLAVRGAAYITVGDLVQEIHHLRADIASKDAALKSAKSELESIVAGNQIRYIDRRRRTGAIVSRRSRP